MRNRLLGYGPFLVTEYTLERVGDSIPMHTHAAPEPNHITIVAEGRVEVRGPHLTPFIMRAGDIHDFGTEAERTHELVSLEPRSIVFNIRKEDASAIVSANFADIIAEGERDAKR